VQTFSKVFGLAGLRLGCIISHSQNIENLIKIHPPFSVNAIALIAGQAALDDTEHIEHIIRRNAIEKDYLYQELKKLGLEVRMTDTNFLLANFGKWSNEVHQKLITRDILVRNMNGQPLLNGYLRITVGTRKENSRLLEALKEIIPPEATIETK
ncbi:MAG: aminotransferase class I/II-fold pyridoxal phosphate-dependent enzyme, partial [candidate division KSB1 bacterium]|nr:aminotransferase class I/II-fold pyridoxal phosphate-dependent enzyme [candidate division KSB1 bacterium]